VTQRPESKTSKQKKSMSVRESDRSGKLQEGILTMIRGFALFLILSFASSSVAVVTIALTAGDRRANTAVAMFFAGALGVGAIVAPVVAWSESKPDSR
jgi:uncharacterized membrane protein